MKSQLIRISPLQTAKVSAILYFIMGALFAIPSGLFMMLSVPPEGAEQGGSFGIWMMIAMPFMYAIMGFILIPICCWVYNITAKWVGGIEFTLQESEGA
jgi:hypothetical protein